MGQFSSYWLYERFEQRGSQEPIPVYPNIYSTNGDGTMTPVVRNEDDTECGYVPPVEPTYRWTNIPITQDYICDECGIAQYRWVNMDSSVDYYCEGTTKYYKQKKQVSYDGGQTWQDVTPPVYQKGGVAESQSTDCGYVPPQYRWVNMDASVDYYCEGTTKYYKQKQQISYDGGQTWQDVTPPVYQKGGVAEEQSTDCGYVPPTPTTKKLVATYIGGITNEVECNDSSTLTTEETKPSGYERSAMTSAVIGDCATSIGGLAFWSCRNLTSVTIPSSVTNIGGLVFGFCSSLTGVTIPNSVTSIGDSVFEYCENLTSANIPDGVTIINEMTFASCLSLRSIIIPSGVTSIGCNAFQECRSLTSIVIPDSVTIIDSMAFGYCSGLTSAIIGNSVTSIGDRAFIGCNGLTSIVIPDSVTSIGNWVFQDCSGFTSITVNATTPPTLGTDAFDNTNDCPLLVPAQSVNAYKTAENWSTYASRIQPIT